MLVETAFATLVLLAWRKVRSRKGMTKERKDIYFAALEFMVNPKDLRELADGYQRDGMTVESSMLRKRADLREMCQEHPEKWENYRVICERAIQKPDANPQALEEMAQGFDAMTATGTAAKLRRRAAERRMEILAFAEESERKIQEAADKAERDAADAAPPTSKNAGVTSPKDGDSNPRDSGVQDPDKTVDPSTGVSAVASAASDESTAPDDLPGEESGAHVSVVMTEDKGAAQPTAR